MAEATDDTLPMGLRHPLRLADLPQRKPTRFEIAPDAATLRALAELLGLTELRKLRMAGQLEPMTGRDWRLTAQLGATVVQPCGITLEPVTTRIDEPVRRIYSATADDGSDTPAAEREMPEDDSLEPLVPEIDLGAVLAEALALAIPAFPRADGAGLGQISAAPKGAAPLTDADTKPFAGLAGLRDKLEKPGG